MYTVDLNSYICTKFWIIATHVYKIQSSYFSDAQLLGHKDI